MPRKEIPAHTGISFGFDQSDRRHVLDQPPSRVLRTVRREIARTKPASVYQVSSCAGHFEKRLMFEWLRETRAF
jgi:hypothetical protein